MVSSSDNDLARQRIQPSRDSLYGTMYAMLVITTIVFFARIGIRLWKKVVATSVDIWLSIAYVCFVAHLINYILATPPLYRQDLVAKGLMDVYPEFVEDSALARKWYVSLLVILAHHCVSKESARQCRRHCLLFMPENPVPNPKTLMQQFFTNSRCSKSETPLNGMSCFRELSQNSRHMLIRASKTRHICQRTAILGCE